MILRLSIPKVKKYFFVFISLLGITEAIRRTEEPLAPPFAHYYLHFGAKPLPYRGIFLKEARSHSIAKPQGRSSQSPKKNLLKLKKQKQNKRKSKKEKARPPPSLPIKPKGLYIINANALYLIRLLRVYLAKASISSSCR